MGTNIYDLPMYARKNSLAACSRPKKLLILTSHQIIPTLLVLQESWPHSSRWVEELLRMIQIDSDSAAATASSSQSRRQAHLPETEIHYESWWVSQHTHPQQQSTSTEAEALREPLDVDQYDTTSEIFRECRDHIFWLKRRRSVNPGNDKITTYLSSSPTNS